MDTFSLSQLNRMVSEVIRETFANTYWLTAEISDVRVNSSGHCYLEFIEKNPSSNALVARAKGNIWNNTFRMLKPYFEQSTGQAFVSGIKILVKVTVDFHELYGYALTVLDIDPAYTMGDMQRQRQQILNQLEEDGVKDMNRELDFPLLPQRIAVITSATAAGYEDFLKQLHSNPYGFVFYPKLFPAVMQGEKTEASIIQALDAIYEYKDLFDLVVVIRGGGATSDLHGFDSYLLAANCAQFPLPIVTGIGHERDETVLDFIANRRAKTPTAVAALLIECMQEAFVSLAEIQQEIVGLSKEKIVSCSENLQADALRLKSGASVLLEQSKNSIEMLCANLGGSTLRLLDRKKHDLEIKEQFLQLSSPRHVLSKGYSITLKNGKAVKSKESLQEGDIIETVLFDGNVTSRVFLSEK